MRMSRPDDGRSHDMRMGLIGMIGPCHDLKLGAPRRSARQGWRETLSPAEPPAPLYPRYFIGRTKYRYRKGERAQVPKGHDAGRPKALGRAARAAPLATDGRGRTVLDTIVYVDPRCEAGRPTQTYPAGEMRTAPARTHSGAHIQERVTSALLASNLALVPRGPIKRFFRFRGYGVSAQPRLLVPVLPTPAKTLNLSISQSLGRFIDGGPSSSRRWRWPCRVRRSSCACSGRALLDLINGR